MKVTVGISEPLAVERFTVIAKNRRYQKVSRAVRVLAEERAKQIEDYGDVPMIPARFRELQTTS